MARPVSIQSDESAFARRTPEPVERREESRYMSHDEDSEKLVSLKDPGAFGERRFLVYLIAVTAV
jgi:hypothetical protein